jgi:putative oxidoreductase
MDKYLILLSRALVAAIFLFSGFGKIIGFQAMVAMAGSAGLPLPTVAIGIAIAIEIAGGLAILLGWQVRWASVALFLFLIPATLVFHAARMQTIEVLKNLAIMGGLLRFYIDASGEAARKDVSSGPDVRAGWKKIA